MRSKRTKWLRTGVSLFLAGVFLLGGCSSRAGEPIKEIDDIEASELEDGFVYVYREKDEEDQYLVQLEEAFLKNDAELALFNIREHTDIETARTSDYGFNQDYHAVAFYKDGERFDQIDLRELNEALQGEGDEVAKELENFIKRNKSE